MGRTRELASAFVRLFVKKDELTAGLNSAQSQVKTSVNKMNQTAATAGSGFSAIGKSIKDSTKPARDFLGAITSTIGLLTRTLGIIGLIGGALGAVVSVYKRINEEGAKQAAMLTAELKAREVLKDRVKTANRENKQELLDEIKALHDIEALEKRRKEIEEARRNLKSDPTLGGLNPRGQEQLSALEKELVSVRRELAEYRALVDRLESSAAANDARELAKRQAEILERMVNSIDSLQATIQQFSRAVSTKKIEQQINYLINRP